MPHARFKARIEAPYERVSELLTDKIERPRKYVGNVARSAVIERGDGFVIRENYEPAPVELVITERITRRPLPDGEEFVYEQLDNAAYTGSFRNVLTRLAGRAAPGVEVEYVMDWIPHAGSEDRLSVGQAEAIVERGVRHLKSVAEREVPVPAWVRAFYDAVDSSDADAIGPMLSEDCRFRVANGTDLIGRDRIVEANRAMFASFAGLHHDYTDVCGDEHRVFIECWVDYTTHDGATPTLPFVTVFERGGGLITSVKVLGDMSPLHPPRPAS